MGLVRTRRVILNLLISTVLILFPVVCNAAKEDEDTVAVQRLDRALHGLSQSGRSCTRCEQGREFAPIGFACPEYVLELLKSNRHRGIIVPSPDNVCQEREPRVLIRPEDLEDFLSREPITTLGIQSRVVSDPRCLSGKFSVSERREAVASYYYYMKRLEQGGLAAMRAVAKIDSLLERPIFGQDSCEDFRLYSINNSCASFRKCRPAGGLDRLVEETDKIRPGFEVLRKQAAGASGEKRRNLEERVTGLVTLYPWLDGKEFRKALEQRAGTREAIVRQLMANREALRDRMRSYAEVSRCLNVPRNERFGACSGFAKVMSLTPDLPDLNWKNRKGREAQQILDVVSQFDRVRCKFEHGITKSESNRYAALTGVSLLVNAATLGEGSLLLSMLSLGGNAVLDGTAIFDAVSICHDSLNQLELKYRQSGGFSCPATSYSGPQLKAKSCLADALLSGAGLLAPGAGKVLTKVARGAKGVRGLKLKISGKGLKPKLLKPIAKFREELSAQGPVRWVLKDRENPARRNFGKILLDPVSGVLHIPTELARTGKEVTNFVSVPFSVAGWNMLYGAAQDHKLKKLSEIRGDAIGSEWLFSLSELGVVARDRVPEILESHRKMLRKWVRGDAGDVLPRLSELRRLGLLDSEGKMSHLNRLARDVFKSNVYAAVSRKRKVEETLHRKWLEALLKDPVYRTMNPKAQLLILTAYQPVVRIGARTDVGIASRFAPEFEAMIPDIGLPETLAVALATEMRPETIRKKQEDWVRRNPGDRTVHPFLQRSEIPRYPDEMARWNRVWSDSRFSGIKQRYLDGALSDTAVLAFHDDLLAAYREVDQVRKSIADRPSTHDLCALMGQSGSRRTPNLLFASIEADIKAVGDARRLSQSERQSCAVREADFLWGLVKKQEEVASDPRRFGDLQKVERGRLQELLLSCGRDPIRCE